MVSEFLYGGSFMINVSNNMCMLEGMTETSPVSTQTSLDDPFEKRYICFLNDKSTTFNGSILFAV